MRPELEARAARLAAEAICTRCQTLIMDDSSAAGLMFLSVRVPLMSVKETHQLCGKCGVQVREFLYPELLGDEKFQSAKHELLMEHWV